MEGVGDWRVASQMSRDRKGAEESSHTLQIVKVRTCQYCCYAKEAVASSRTILICDHKKGCEAKFFVVAPNEACGGPDLLSAFVRRISWFGSQLLLCLCRTYSRVLAKGKELFCGCLGAHIFSRRKTIRHPARQVGDGGPRFLCGWHAPRLEEWAEILAHRP